MNTYIIVTVDPAQAESVLGTIRRLPYVQGASIDRGEGSLVVHSLFLGLLNTILPPPASPRRELKLAPVEATVEEAAALTAGRPTVPLSSEDAPQPSERLDDEDRRVVVTSQVDAVVHLRKLGYQEVDSGYYRTATDGDKFVLIDNDTNEVAIVVDRYGEVADERGDIDIP